MKNYLKLSRLQVIVLSMVLADVIVVSLFACLQLTLGTSPTLVSANTFGRMTHSLVVNNTGRLYLTWIEKAIEKSTVMFATSVDFGRKWSREVACETPNFRLGPDEAKLDNISMVIDRNGKAHIAFMQNLRSRRGYGDEYPWTFIYVTNKGGKWSAAEEIRGPWNTDWMGTSARQTRAYVVTARGSPAFGLTSMPIRFCMRRAVMRAGGPGVVPYITILGHRIQTGEQRRSIGKMSAGSKDTTTSANSTS